MSGRHPALVGWLAFWRWRRRYHRYRVVGIEKLDGPAKLLVAYHGRPLAYDQMMLSVSLYERYGYLPHGVIHRAVSDLPPLDWMSDGLGFVTGDGPGIEAAVARGEHIAVQPGGTREGCRSVRHRYRVRWGTRTGYLRLAHRHGLEIVPLAASGVDHTYIGLNDGYRWGKRLGAPSGLPVWLGIGLGGLWPVAPPLPVRITTYVGDPISLDGVDMTDPAAVLRVHHEVQDAVQELLNEAN